MLISSLGSASGGLDSYKMRMGEEATPVGVESIEKKRTCWGERISKFCYEWGMNFSLRPPGDFPEGPRERSGVLPGCCIASLYVSPSPDRTLWNTVALGDIVITPPEQIRKPRLQVTEQGKGPAGAQTSAT